MSQKHICDICGQAVIGDDAVKFTLSTRLTSKSADTKPEPERMDLCDECYRSPVILSEMRRTRTRKRKPGRPRKVKIDLKAPLGVVVTGGEPC